ncbi:MAG: ankyrin repeat domain-containing protein [Gemmataceae bacterium]|nr:ankyrin repeat domain-containing protein [Gemmataceae bacterium]
MNPKPLPFRSTLDQYQAQAEALLAAHHAGDPQALCIIHRCHPRFLDANIPWLARNLSPAEIQNAAFDLADAQLTVARGYNFRDWHALIEYVDAVTQDGAVSRFEAAVEAIITGDLAGLQALLREHPGLVHARSTRVTNFDPPVHRATLLHYVAANGVESYRQQTPRNAVDIAKALLEAGAEVDALAGMYGGQYTTMSMLVSSSPPAEAGVQIALVETLLDHGASIEGRGSPKWGSPLMTALVFGFPAVAEALVRRGAAVDNVAAAAGLGRPDRAAELLASADADSRHRALALAAQLGHAEVVRLLLDAGEDPNRYNPDGTHAHATPLHQAALAGHDAVVRMLVERGARLDIKDTIYQSTPLGWAAHAKQTAIEEYLRGRGAK